MASRERRILTRFFQGRSRWMAAAFKAILWGLGCKGITAATGIESSGVGHTRIFLVPDGPPSTFEVLVYEMPFGLVFRKAVLWHNAEQRVFRNLTEIKRDQETLRWDFRCFMRDGFELEIALDGSGASTASFALRKNRLSGHLGSDEQQPGESDTVPEAARRIGGETGNDVLGR